MIDRLEVLAGIGSVIRRGDLVAWAAPTASPSLVSFIDQSARNLAGSPDSGKRVVDHLASILEKGDPEPGVGFVVVDPEGDTWGAVLHGAVQAWDGGRWVAPGSDPGWMRCRLTPQPSIAVSSAGEAAPAASLDSMWDLESGVVPGGGFVLTPQRDAAGQLPRDAAAPPHPGAQPSRPDPQPSRPDAQPSRPHAARQPSRPDAQPSRPHAARQPSRPDAQPFPPDAQQPHQDAPGQPQAQLTVTATLCGRGHANRPGMTQCARCGQAVLASRIGRIQRPPLGCLVVDDGSIFRLDAGYAAGSDPGRHGADRFLVLEGRDVSPLHTEIRLDGWEVMAADQGSAGGTFVYGRGDSSWVRLAPFEWRVLEPGTHLAVGGRVLTYVTPYVVQDPETRSL